jgi:hypothetical protein
MRLSIVSPSGYLRDRRDPDRRSEEDKVLFGVDPRRQTTVMLVIAGGRAAGVGCLQVVRSYR